MEESSVGVLAQRYVNLNDTVNFLGLYSIVISGAPYKNGGVSYGGKNIYDG